STTHAELVLQADDLVSRLFTPSCYSSRRLGHSRGAVLTCQINQMVARLFAPSCGTRRTYRVSAAHAELQLTRLALSEAASGSTPHVELLRLFSQVSAIRTELLHGHQANIGRTLSFRLDCSRRAAALGFISAVWARLLPSPPATIARPMF